MWNSTLHPKTNLNVFQDQISTTVKRSQNQLPSKANFSTFCNFIALVLSSNFVKGLAATRDVEEIKFKGCVRYILLVCF